MPRSACFFPPVEEYFFVAPQQEGSREEIAGKIRGKETAGGSEMSFGVFGSRQPRLLAGFPADVASLIALHPSEAVGKISQRGVSRRSSSLGYQSAIGN